MLKWHVDNWDYLWLVKMISLVIFVTAYALGATALTSGFNYGSGQFWLSNVQCVGNETRLIDCRHSFQGTNYNCRYRYAGVTCPPIGKNCDFELVFNN